jgi:anti-sigma B factor antagonist
MPASPANAFPPGHVTIASVADSDEMVIAQFFRHDEALRAGDGRTTTIVSVEGDIDIDTAPYLERALQRAVHDSVAVCCDFGRTEFFGAAGVSALFSVLREARDAGAAFTIRGVHPIVGRVLDAVGFDRSLIVE